MGITPGIPRPGGGGLGDIPANTALGNFTEASAVPTPQTKSVWLTWLNAATVDDLNSLGSVVSSIGSSLTALSETVATKVSEGDPRLTNARDWFASSVSQAEAEAGTEVIDRKWSALRVRQSTRVNPDWDPTGNLFTIGTSTNAQRLRLRRRFAGAGDFSQLSIDFSGDNCRIQTQHAGNNPNPLCLGTAGVDRLFLSADATRVGIGGAPTTRPLEIFAGTAGFRLQSSSAVSPPVYTEIARTFDFQTWQDSTSPFNTFTDLVANSNQFNNHSVRLFVHTSGVSAPVLHSVFHSSGRLLVGTDVDNGTDRLQVNGGIAASGNITASQVLSTAGLSLSAATGQNVAIFSGVTQVAGFNAGGMSLRSAVGVVNSVNGNSSIVLRDDLNYIGLNADKRLVWSSSTGTANLFSGSLGLALGRDSATRAAFYTSASGTSLADFLINNITASGTIDGTSFRQASDTTQALIPSGGQWNIDCTSGFRFRNTGAGFATRFVVDASGNLTASGTLTLGGATDVLIPSAPSTRETIFRARISDAGNDAFHIYNATIGDGGFAAGFSGSRFTSAASALVFAANIDAANDTGSNAMVEFLARRTSSQTDPNNGTLSDVVTRPLFAWRTQGTIWAQMFANGNLALNSTTDNGARLQVNGNVATSGQIISTVGNNNSILEFSSRFGQAANGNGGRMIVNNFYNSIQDVPNGYLEINAGNGGVGVALTGRDWNHSFYTNGGFFCFGRDIFVQRDAANVWAQRNGTSAQIARWYKTFTSSTILENFEIDTATDAGSYRLASRVGSAGGSIREIHFGRYNAANAWLGFLSLNESSVNPLRRVNAVIDLGANSGEVGSVVFAHASAAGGSNGSAFRGRVANNNASLFIGFNSTNAEVFRVDGSGNTTTSGVVTSAFQSLSADPSTIDLASGMHRVVKNTTSGEVRDWVNDGGIMKKSPAYT